MSTRDHFCFENPACTRISFACLFFIFASGMPLGASAHEGHADEDGQGRQPKQAPGNPAGTFQNQVEIITRGKDRIIKSNGLPEHATGAFPGRGNPHRIAPQRHEFQVPARPKVADKPTRIRLGKFGVALNGVPIDPGAAEFWQRDFSSPWQYAVINGKIDLGLDHNLAHVQPGGEYHYHGRPVDLIKQLRNEARSDHQRMTLIGYAGDGFPIYDCVVFDESGQRKTLRPGYRLKTGERPSENNGPGGTYDGTFLADWQYVPGTGDLDEFNGARGPTPEYPDGTFYYVMTKEFPYVPRQFIGTPDPSFALGGPGGRRGPPGRPSRRFGPPGFGPPGSPPPPRPPRR